MPTPKKAEVASETSRVVPENSAHAMVRDQIGHDVDEERQPVVGENKGQDREHDDEDGEGADGDSGTDTANAGVPGCVRHQGVPNRPRGLITSTARNRA
jgi:hypothetical protein